MYVNGTSILATIAIIFLIVLLLFIATRRQSPQRKMAKILNTIAHKEIKNIIIPDGIGGIIEIEHLLLLDQGLLIIETYNIGGNLFGGDTIDQWTQIMKGRSYKFANPLRRIHTSKQALLALVPGIPIYYRIVFNADSVFPKGKPDDVSVLESLEHDLEFIKTKAMMTDKVRQAWQKIMRIARKNGQAVNTGAGNG